MRQSMIAVAGVLVLSVAAGVSAQPKAHADPELQTNLERAKYGDPQALFTIYFDHGSVVLSPSARAVLDRAAERLGGGSIEVAGHTSGLGDDTADKHLSDRRAQVVRQYLIAHGVAAERLSAMGYGKTQPADSNATEEGRAHNRRVVLRAGPPQG